MEYTRRAGSLHVLIVGGSVAALTLANCLHHLSIDFTILEAYPDLAPNIGASIVLLPNGARILDQLGIYNDMCSAGEPILKTVVWTADGKVLTHTNGPELIMNRHGYPLRVLRRMDMLRVLADHVVEKERVKTGKRVVRIEHLDEGVVAHCTDGSVYRGDIIVGADGIHSTVRKAMQDHIESLHPGKTMKDRKAVSAEYSVIFGLGGPLSGDKSPRESQRTYSSGRSILSFVGNDETLYWFLFTRLDRKYVGDEIPKYSTKDAEETAEKFFDMSFDGVHNFKEVWDKRTMTKMLPMEEAQFENWTEGRFVCIGDSIHKMTANLGGGGNAAIESAAALANALSVLPRHNPPLDAIRSTLHSFYRQRHYRADKVCDAANELSRLEVLNTAVINFMVHLLLPRVGDANIHRTCSVIVGGELLNFLPAPSRSLKATMPWNRSFGVGVRNREKKLHRAIWALPLLAMVYGCNLTMGSSIQRLLMTRDTGTMTLGNGIETALWARYFGLAKLDNVIQIYVAFFTPAIGGFDPIGRLQMIAFLADIVPVQVIWMVEANRRGNILTIASMVPTLIAQMYQIRGIGFLGPIYYFLHYFQIPMERYAARDQRMINMGKAKIIIWTILISYIIPTVTMFVAPELTSRQWINGLFFHPFPLWAVLTQSILTKFIKDTTEVDKFIRPEADMPYLRRAYAFAAMSSASAYLYVYGSAWKSSISLLDIFFRDISKPNTIAPLFDGAAKVLRYDHLWSFGAGLFWVLLSFSDLKKAGKLQTGWGKILGLSALSTLTAGPGAAMAVMWAWREEVLAGPVGAEALKEE